ncbi:MAG: hypothetical protein HY831_04450 [Candidatus Aenigmarchaeota archaeon]|nr:hypothetical protein [Candidatus Aenigmarchaeota archaeon]
MEQLKQQGFLDLSDTQYFEDMNNSGIVSGTSFHSDRIATIKEVYKETGIIVDPHTADGIKVGLEYRDSDVPLICLSTAKPVKFEETIRDALGFVPQRPKKFRNIEKKEQRFEIMDPSVDKLKDYIAKHAIRN